ncbi:hypothetical protein K440DRAFT_676382 [Wilcoxina mikolae CBS 423.85]|nr:hypothetical protein K440DRAFT_676382 [Wilcoxina mikolae CBS 423.85]
MCTVHFFLTMKNGTLYDRLEVKRIKQFADPIAQSRAERCLGTSPPPENSPGEYSPVRPADPDDELQAELLRLAEDEPAPSRVTTAVERIIQGGCEVGKPFISAYYEIFFGRGIRVGVPRAWHRCAVSSRRRIFVGAFVYSQFLRWHLSPHHERGRGRRPLRVSWSVQRRSRFPRQIQIHPRDGLPTNRFHKVKLPIIPNGFSCTTVKLPLCYMRLVPVVSSSILINHILDLPDSTSRIPLLIRSASTSSNRQTRSTTIPTGTGSWGLFSQPCFRKTGWRGISGCWRKRASMRFWSGGNGSGR